VHPSLASYCRARKDFFDRYGQRWPATLADAFDILEVYPLQRAEVNEIRKASSCLAGLFAKALALLECASDEVFTHLGVPDRLKDIVKVRIPGLPACVMGRFDLARSKDGYKLLEFNADSPGLVVEAFSVNSGVCRHAGRPDPNEGTERMLADALAGATQAAVAHLKRPAGARTNVVVSAWGYSARDQAIASYLRDLLQPLAAIPIPVEQIRIDDSGVYTPTGEAIDVLVRAFPLDSISKNGFQRRGKARTSEVGTILSRLIEDRHVALVNAPAAFLLGGKALQVLIWGLYEAGKYFHEEDRRLIEKYMVPVYLDPPTNESAYAVKPIYGSEGDSVLMLDAQRRVISASLDTTYVEQPAVYQRYIDLPHEELMTEYGPQTLHLVTSCFVISGRASAICIRAGEAITNELAWVLPICIED
jgi:glutathionylspermidine synthase